jgi:hypothetical protein
MKIENFCADLKRRNVYKVAVAFLRKMGMADAREK